MFSPSAFWERVSSSDWFPQIGRTSDWEGLFSHVRDASQKSVGTTVNDKFAKFAHLQKGVPHLAKEKDKVVLFKKGDELHE